MFLKQNQTDNMKSIMLEELPSSDGVNSIFILYYEGDDVSELYGGTLVDGLIHCFSREFSPSFEQTSSAYSLRQPEVTPSLIEKARQIFEERKQQSLDNSAE